MTIVDGRKISVCLLTYDHVHLIESTVRSILSQSCQGFELIISDDCSTDGTWEKVLDLARQDHRIRPLRTPDNFGMPGNANYAVARSSRPYIALLHHDDLYRSDLLEKWAGVLERHPDVGFVCNLYKIDQSDFVYSNPFSDEVIDGDVFLRNHLLPRWGCPVRGTAMIRRSKWNEVGGMREQFNLLADVDLWMRLARTGSVGYVPEPLIVIRQDRPKDYPDVYGDRSWSWLRQKYLYQIHGSNRLECLNLKSLRGRLEWLKFRIRVSAETIKWIVYAVVKHKPQMILSSREGSTTYDLFVVNLIRNALVRLYKKGH